MFQTRRTYILYHISQDLSRWCLLNMHNRAQPTAAFMTQNRGFRGPNSHNWTGKCPTPHGSLMKSSWNWTMIFFNFFWTENARFSFHAPLMFICSVNFAAKQIAIFFTHLFGTAQPSEPRSYGTFCGGRVGLSNDPIGTNVSTDSFVLTKRSSF